MTEHTTEPEVGSLDWQPAGDHPELLAAPVAAALNVLGQAAWVAPIDPALADTAAFCEAYQVPPAASANCVVVSGRRAETERTAACLVLATARADGNRGVRRRRDARTVAFAPMAAAVGGTRVQYGGRPPTGPPAGRPTRAG